MIRSREVGDKLKGKLALFNDGIFASSTDLGTYGTAPRREAGEQGSWCREEELEWQSRHMGAVPNGGEALAGSKPISYADAAEEMKKMHLSYLNSAYQQEQLGYWKQESVRQQGCWEGLSGYDYIGRHLGYRFIVCDAKLLKGKQLQVTVENVGFAALCEEAECFLVAEEKDGRIAKALLDADAREWKSQGKSLLKIVLPQNMSRGTEYRLYLELRRKSDGRVLKFANKETGEKVLLGIYIGK